MPSGYMKNASGVGKKEGRGSSSKDSKGSPRHSPKGGRAHKRSSPKENRRGPPTAAAAAASGGDGAQGSEEDESQGGAGKHRMPAGPKVKGPAAGNPTKDLMREVEREVEPDAQKLARETGRRLKIAACAAALDDFDGGTNADVAARVDSARVPLAKAVRECREAVDAFELGDVSGSRAYAELLIAAACLEAFDAVPAAQFAKEAADRRGYGGAMGDEPVRGAKYTFTAVDRPDWASVTAWKALDQAAYDGAALDLMGEPLGDGKDDPVVELSCTTPGGMRCIFRKSVIEQCLQSTPVCPQCSFQYPVPGAQPSGDLAVSVQPFACSGYPKHKTISMYYNFPSGTQGPRMLRPKQSYCGTMRVGYLPDNKDGRDAAALLIKGFKAGWLFVVGDSVTTGARNQVVWGGVHQKTSPSGGPTCHGWPDPTYFDRLVHECAASGVFTDKYEKQMAEATKRARKAAAIAAANHKTGHRGPSEDAAAAAAAPDAAVSELQAKIEELGASIQAAMKDRDMKAIRALMAERGKLQDALAKASA